MSKQAFELLDLESGFKYSLETALDVLPTDFKITLPDKNGTLALIKDIEDLSSKLIRGDMDVENSNKLGGVLASEYALANLSNITLTTDIVNSLRGYTGSQGLTGATGQGFVIGTVFNSLAELLAGTTTNDTFGLVGGTLSPDADDYGKLYLYKDAVWTYITDMSVKGAAGITGPQGVIGYTGSKGIDGINGYTGSAGIDGLQGLQGYTGSKGIDGIGYTGSKGIDGINGTQGYVGSQGLMGYTGSIGATGQGFSISATFNSLAELLAGTTTDNTFGLVAGTLSPDADDYGKLYHRFNNTWTYITDMSVKGAAGITGPQGNTGYTGSQGVIGLTGSTGYSGSIGPTGNIGYTGSIGFTGSKGEVGVLETRYDLGALNNLDLNLGNLFTKALTANTTFTVSNPKPTGNTNSFILELTNGGNYIITWWSGIKWSGGIAPVLTSSGIDILGFYSYDNGTTWRGMVLSKDSK